MVSQIQSVEKRAFPCYSQIGFFGSYTDVGDTASRKFSFGFAPGCSGTFSEWKGIGEGEPFLQILCEEALNVATVP